METATVNLGDYGELCCENCGASLECDQNGDFPELCPVCGAKLDYSKTLEESICLAFLIFGVSLQTFQISMRIIGYSRSIGMDTAQPIVLTIQRKPQQTL